MFRAIIWMQWKSTRALSLLTTIIAFALPLASLQLGRSVHNTASDLVLTMQAFGAAYALLAALVGLLVALGAWRPDHAGRHVYALSLPVPRSRYAMFRFGAGVLFLAPTIAGLLVGALLVSVSPIPEGLHAFPIALTLRFALASLVAYSIFFAIASSTNRTAGLIIALFAGIIFSQYLLAVFADGTHTVDMLGTVLDFVFVRPGILSVFAGRWMLIDA